ncbi:MAG: hypothetical protein KC503_41905 [Myxococcales bacterium]|nr:hypothetical protein [Myxococcales bacterium]
MSILWTLRKHIDAIEQREEDAQRRKAREVPHTIREEGGARRRQPTAPEPPPQRYICRCCDTISNISHYCPKCLADTMVPYDEQDEG